MGWATGVNPTKLIFPFFNTELGHCIVDFFICYKHSNLAAKWGKKFCKIDTCLQKKD
jgi:hypothetical protein